MAWDDPQGTPSGVYPIVSNIKWFKNNEICLSTQLQNIKNTQAIICSIFVFSAQK